MDDSAFLEITVGPMFSGKTNKLIETYNQLESSNICFVVNHTFDKFKSDKYIYSHSNNKIECNMYSSLSEIMQSEQNDKFQKCQYLFINEAQFFPDLIQCVKTFLLKKKKIFLYGLDADFNGEKFGCMLDLIPIADNILKLNGKCSNCPFNRKSIFSSRKIDSNELILVGNEDKYIPHCRHCFNKFKISTIFNGEEINIL
jgi:thymidine kinase